MCSTVLMTLTSFCGHIFFLHRGTREHSNFWTFFHRYRQFQSRHASGSKDKKEKDDGMFNIGSIDGVSHANAHTQTGHSTSSSSPKFGLPREYNRSYRIGFSVVPLTWHTSLEKYRIGDRTKERESPPSKWTICTSSGQH